MSNIQLIIEERAAEIGGFMVGRLLPFRQAREDWINRNFPMPPGETEFVPYPTLKK